MFDQINLLKTAIKTKTQIEIVYDNMGRRIISPAALYYHPGTGKLLIEGFQTRGYSESGEVPAWKMFEVNRISRTSTTDSSFSMLPGYNSSSRRYTNYVAKI